MSEKLNVALVVVEPSLTLLRLPDLGAGSEVMLLPLARLAGLTTPMSGEGSLPL